MTPEARTDQVLAQDVGDEVVVYDERTFEAHRLNRTAALVWKLANGRRSVGEMSAVLHRVLDVPDDEDFVRLALAELDKAGLLAHPLPGAGELISRRQLFGVAAALLPLVVSIVAPSPAMAATITHPVKCEEVTGHYAASGTSSGTCPSGTKPPTGSIMFECDNSKGTFTLRLWDDPNNRQNLVYTGKLGSLFTFSGTGPGGSLVSGKIVDGVMTLTEAVGSCKYQWTAKKDR